MATLNGDSAADAMNLLQRLLREEGTSPSLESFVAEWMVPQRRSGQALLEHLRELLLSGAIGLEWVFNRTHVCLGDRVMDRHYRRRRSDYLSQGELAEFAGAVWRARHAAPSVPVQWQPSARKTSDLRAHNLSR